MTQLVKKLVTQQDEICLILSFGSLQWSALLSFGILYPCLTTPDIRNVTWTMILTMTKDKDDFDPLPSFEASTQIKTAVRPKKQILQN